MLRRLRAVGLDVIRVGNTPERARPRRGQTGEMVWTVQIEVTRTREYRNQRCGKR